MNHPVRIRATDAAYVNFILRTMGGDFASGQRVIPIVDYKVDFPTFAEGQEE